MPRYRVTLTRTAVEIVAADNPYQAAIVASGRDSSAEVVDVRPAVGRPPVTTTRATASKKKTAKKVAKKRKPLSPEARAKLAQNLEKARAVRAAKANAAKTTTKKRAVKKAAKKRR